MRFLGLEMLHPFDAGKWGNVFKYLKNSGLINDETVSVPNEATAEDLLIVHTKKYLKSLKVGFLLGVNHGQLRLNVVLGPVHVLLILEGKTRFYNF